MTTARVTRIIAAIDSLNDADMKDFLNLYELRAEEPEVVFAPAPAAPEPAADPKPEPKKTKVETKHEAVDFTPDMSGDKQDTKGLQHPF